MGRQSSRSEAKHVRGAPKRTCSKAHSADTHSVLTCRARTPHRPATRGKLVRQGSEYLLKEGEVLEVLVGLKEGVARVQLG